MEIALAKGVGCELGARYVLAGSVGGAIPRSIPAEALAPNAMMGPHVGPDAIEPIARYDGEFLSSLPVLSSVASGATIGGNQGESGGKSWIRRRIGAGQSLDRDLGVGKKSVGCSWYRTGPWGSARRWRVGGLRGR